MKSIAEPWRFERLCAAVLLVCAASLAAAESPTAGPQPGVHAPDSAQDEAAGDAGAPAQAKAPQPCPASTNRSAMDAPAGEPSILRKLACWWQDGLSRQVRALIP